MNKIIGIKISGDYTLTLQFKDGESRTINFQPLIGKGVSAALLDKDY